MINIYFFNFTYPLRFLRVPRGYAYPTLNATDLESVLVSQIQQSPGLKKLDIRIVLRHYATCQLIYLLEHSARVICSAGWIQLAQECPAWTR
jgi:hypothetical protein